MADINEDDLKASAEEIAKIAGQSENVLAIPTDVSQIDQVERCESTSESGDFSPHWQLNSAVLFPFSSAGSRL